MGMYTELVFKASFFKGIPSDVRAVLEHLFKEGPLPTLLPEHPFFAKKYWSCVGNCCSYYHHPKVVNSWSEEPYSSSINVFSRSDLKDYDEEIAAFLDWVKPYLDQCDGECIGWSWYEEADEPTLIYAQKREGEE